MEGFFLDDAETVVVAYGSVSRSALSAVRRARDEQHKVGLLKLNTIWPVPEKEIRAACANAKRVIVAEMNVGDYASASSAMTKWRRSAPSAVYSRHRPRFTIRLLR